MSLNPTSTNASPASTNMPALYGLQTSSGEPFTNALAAQPTDWTVGILYTGGTTPLNDPQNMAADASGNIWVINHNGTTSASLTELNPVGSPLVNVSTIGGQSISIIQPRNEAVDLNGNVWLDTTSSARELEYNVGTPANSISYTPPTGGSPYGIAIDKNNNVFYTHESSSATATVDEFLAPSVSAGATLASTALVEYALASATCCGNVVQEAEYAAIDTSGNLWMTNGSSTSGDETNIFVMSAYNGATAGVCTVFPCAVGTTGDTTLTQTYTNAASATGNVPTLSEPWGIAAGTGGSIWTPNKTGNTVTEMTAFTTGTNFGSAVSLNAPEYVAVDGAGNVWVVNDIATPASVSEFSSAGAVLSPTTTTTSFATTPVIGFSHAGMSTSQGITIDPSGNIWIANSVSSTGGVFEIVGAATPTVTPIALALKNGTVGVRP